jgi:HAD superfamily hydrolase (TIGR01509 family)
MAEIKAVIFDVDGLMVDTERMSFRILQQIARDYGLNLGDEHYPRIIGMDLIGTAEYVSKHTGMQMAPEALNEVYLARFERAVATQIEPNPGLLELIGALQRRGLPLGVASNSPTEYLERVLRAIHVREALRVVVGRDQVENGKPAPDVYLRAAEGLDADPHYCLAIEDSPIGMRSALNAGMRCAVVNELEEVPAFAAATARYSNLWGVVEGLEEILRMKDEG